MNTLDDIDRIILFKFANYFLKFSTESKKQSGKKDLANDWYEYVEYGTMNQLSILLQKSGFSRETASFIKKNKNEFISESEGIMHLSPTLLNCDDSIVQREAKESNRPITKYIEKGSKVLSTLEPFSIYMLS